MRTQSTSSTPRVRERPIRSVVLVTASEPEPRSFGKQVVLGGILDHLVDRLGENEVHVVLIGRPTAPRPAVPYHLHVIDKPAASSQLRSVATRVAVGPRSSLQEAALWSAKVRDELARTLYSIGADLEVWDTMRTGQYARDLPRRPRVLYADDLFSLRYASMLDRIASDPTRIANPLGEFQKLLPGPARRIAASPRIYKPLLQFERDRCDRSEVAAPELFDATVLVSADETKALQQRTDAGSIHTLIPMLPDPRRPQRRFDGRPRFVFLGSLDYAPNRDGLSWFLRTCREAVLGAVPDFELLLVGRGSEVGLPEAADWGPHVRGLGWVDDLDGVLGSAAGLLSPLRMGSGAKIKVLEALARGLPVVGTHHGLLGLGVGPEDGCLAGTTPAELATLLDWAARPEENTTLSAGALRIWRDRFAPSAIASAYDEVFGLEAPIDRSSAAQLAASS